LANGENAPLSGAGDDARHFQIGAPVQPGNSGGVRVGQGVLDSPSDRSGK
jgi:hypothetical protein